MKNAPTAEHQRLIERDLHTKPWQKWGPYLSERQWGTVREDYSADGSAWDSFPHDMARSRAYRWGEDGIAGISDDKQQLCFAVAMWNGNDPILKERLFGLTGPEGNHGEDVKEHYYYLDATPTHSYLKMLYKYPQPGYPYDLLVHENRARGKHQGEFELIETGIFDADRYFDVFVEYAKADVDDILIRITAHNRGPDDHPLHLLPAIWFRNTWSWDRDSTKPSMRSGSGGITIEHKDLPPYTLYVEGSPGLLFCDNETNSKRLWNSDSGSRYPKDAFHDYVVHGQRDAVNPEQTGTKAAAHFPMMVPAKGSATVRLRLTAKPMQQPFAQFDQSFDRAIRDADEFYDTLQQGVTSADERRVQRQAFAGMIWSKQFYHIDVPRWLNGDPAQVPPPASRKFGRNNEWPHLNNADIVSMPDKWEYPWYAAWDLAFHCVPLAQLDVQFAKDQLLLLTREWFMHPNGQLPAYEWAFGDVNPPVHAWATWKVYQMEKAQRGQGDRGFLERVFHKLLLNFNWWVNRKDASGRNIFQGGFLGLDNIGVFDRSAPLPTGGHLSQCDGTAWMAMYALNLMRIAIELAGENNVYADLATKFFEHFLYIAAAMNNVGGQGISLWCDRDEFFYDVLCPDHGQPIPLKVRSLVGLIPLLAVEVLDEETLDRVPEFKARLEWFLDYRPDLASLVSRWDEPGAGRKHLLSLLRGHRMKCLLKRMLDPDEFLSEYGIRALSRVHRDNPYRFDINGMASTVRYTPAESDTHLFGGNSNWRGPIWMPTNYLLIESLRRFHDYYGDDFRVEHPAGSGRRRTLHQVADNLAERLTSIFTRDENGRRPVFDHDQKLQTDPHFRDYVLFHEYFDGDTGRGVGASHQTGWTGLIASLISEQAADNARHQNAAVRIETASIGEQK